MSKIYVEKSTPNDDIRVLVVKTSKKKRKNKRSRGTKEMERGVRRLADSVVIEWKNYSKRHKKSNSKRRDGWIKDYPVNVFRANRKFRKNLKPLKVFGM